jgi:hypothetical protein
MTQRYVVTSAAGNRRFVAGNRRPPDAWRNFGFRQKSGIDRNQNRAFRLQFTFLFRCREKACDIESNQGNW